MMVESKKILYCEICDLEGKEVHTKMRKKMILCKYHRELYKEMDNDKTQVKHTKARS